MKRIFFVLLLVIFIVLLAVFVEYRAGKKETVKTNAAQVQDSTQVMTGLKDIPSTPEGELIKYGRSLVANTSYYFGPGGTLAQVSNSLDCQNCHLDAGTKPYGNNFYLVSQSYPRYKQRSGAMESIEKKVEDCFERSMNGQIIDSTGKEMKAFVAYLNWVGRHVQKGTKPTGSGIEELPYMNRAADTVKGRLVFINKCQVCHGENGDGQDLPDSTGKIYPPVWGPHSYNIGASIYRIGKFAGFVKNNMPFGITHQSPLLTNEEAWDVAGFVNSQFHPWKDLSGDWPKLAEKPVDYPFGPYADTFSEAQHKYGPFEPIKSFYKTAGKN